MAHDEHRTAVPSVVHDDGPDVIGFYRHTSTYSSAKPLLDRNEGHKIECLNVSPQLLSDELMRQLTGLKKLYITMYLTKDAPDFSAIGHVAATLESLIINGSSLVVHVPPEIARCRKLTYLQIVGMQGTTLAKEIGSLPLLRVIGGFIYIGGTPEEHDWQGLQREWRQYLAEMRGILDHPERLCSDLAGVVLSYF